MKTVYKMIIVGLICLVILIIFAPVQTTDVINEPPIEEESMPIPVFNGEIGALIVDEPLDDIIIYLIEEPLPPPLRYGFTEEDIFLLSQLLAGDENISGDGEYDFTWFIQHGQDYSLYEIYKVLNVVMNRVRSDDWPNTVKGVVTQKGQFAVMPRNLQTNPSPLVIEVIRDWCEAYDSWNEIAQVVPEDHMFFHSAPNYTNVTRANWK